MFLPSMFPNLCSASYLMSCLFMCFPIFFSLPAPCRTSAGHAWSRLQRMAGGGKKEGGRKADACDSVGAVMRVPTMEKQSVRPEHTAHSRTHAQNSEGVMGWQRPGASLTHTHKFTTHYMVNNEEGEPPPSLSTTR